MSKIVSPEVPATNKFAFVDAPMVRQQTAPVAIGRVRRMSDFFPGNVINDRVSMEPKKAAWLAQQGLLILEVASASPQDIEAAGGVDGFLKKQPQKDKLSKAARAKLAPIPGIPSDRDLPPWEYMDVEE